MKARGSLLGATIHPRFDGRLPLGPNAREPSRCCQNDRFVLGIAQLGTKQKSFKNNVKSRREGSAHVASLQNLPKQNNICYPGLIRVS